MITSNRLLAVIRWSSIIWGAVFITVFSLGLSWSSRATLLYHRRLHASIEAPALCGHLAADLFITMSGLVHSFCLFNDSKRTSGSAVDLRPVHARLWAQLSLKWTLGRLAMIAVRLWIPYAAVVLIAYGYQSQRSYGQFRQATESSLQSALWLTGPDDRYEYAVAPWLWPLAHIIRFTILTFSACYVLVACARACSNASSAVLMCLTAVCSCGREVDAEEEWRRRDEGRRGTGGQARRMTWSDFKTDASRACRRCSSVLPPVTSAIRSMNRFVYTSLDVIVIVVSGAAFAYGCWWRVKNSPIISPNMLHYSPQAVSSPFYDVLFTHTWAHVPSFAAGVGAAYWLATAPRGTATPISARVVWAMCAIILLLFSAYDVTYWVLALPDSWRKVAVGLYLPAYSSCAAVCLAFGLRSPTIEAYLTSGRTGKFMAWLNLAQPMLIHLYILYPLVVVGIVSSSEPSEDPEPGIASGYTAQALLATLPIAAIAAVVQELTVYSAKRCLCSRIVHQCTARLLSTVVAGAPYLGHAWALVFPPTGRENGSGESDPEGVRAVAVASRDAWIMGKTWRGIVRRQLRQGARAPATEASAEVMPAERGFGGTRAAQTSTLRSSSSSAAIAPDDGTVDDPDERMRLVSAYILTRLADEASENVKARPASADTPIDIAVGVIVSAGTVAAAAARMATALSRNLSGAGPVASDAPVRNGAGGVQGIQWSRSSATVVPEAAEKDPLLDDGNDEGKIVDPNDIAAAAATPADRWREWYTRASLTLALEWSQGAGADDSTLLALVDQLAEDISQVIKGAQADEEEDAGDDDDDDDDANAQGPDRFEGRDGAQVFRRRPPAGPQPSRSIVVPPGSSEWYRNR